MLKLSGKQIKQRLAEGRNYKRLYHEQHTLNLELKALAKRLETKLDELKQQNKTQAIRIAELETMVFGKKHRPPTGTPAPTNPLADVPKSPRTKGSYRRPLPPATAITTTELIPINHCRCGGELTKLSQHERYLEDVPLPELTPDYGVYRALPDLQQLCWAHLYRCIRDLCYNDNLPEEYLPDVIWWYEQFAGIYQDLRVYLDEPYDQATRVVQSNQLWQRLQALLLTHAREPVKLTKLKAQLTRAGPAKLFACLVYDTPCDNNRAERDLRQLVLKRKRSFGSQTEKGATALSTILSVCTTTWRSNPTGYFTTLAQLG